MPNCPTCGCVKTLSNTSPSSSKSDGLTTYCRTCANAHRRAADAARRAARSVPFASAPKEDIASDALFDIDEQPLVGAPVLGTRASFILCVGDLHFPYHDPEALDRMFAQTKSLPVDLVVQLGDLFDQYSFSRYHPDPAITHAASELGQARACAVRFWHRAQEMWPGAQCLQISGNHDARAAKRIAELLPAISSVALPGLRDLYRFDGVRTVFDDKQEVLVQGPQGPLYLMHGYRAHLGEHRDWNLASTVCGHSHHGGVSVRNTRHGTLFELNAGWLGRVQAPVFSYRPQRVVNSWTLGYGLVTPEGPRFVSL